MLRNLILESEVRAVLDVGTILSEVACIRSVYKQDLTGACAAVGVRSPYRYAAGRDQAVGENIAISNCGR